MDSSGLPGTRRGGGRECHEADSCSPSAHIVRGRTSSSPMMRPAARRRQPNDDAATTGATDLPGLLDEYMRANKLTLAAMAERTGLSLPTIAALRDGTRGKRPRPDTVQRLAAAIGVGTDVIYAAVDAGIDLDGRARNLERPLLLLISHDEGVHRFRRS